MAVDLAAAIRARGGNHKVLGVKGTLDDLILRDTKLGFSEVLGNSVEDATLTRTIGGATNISIDVHDPERRFLRMPLFQNRFETNLDGLRFRYRGFSKAGPDMTVKFTERNAARLQEVFGYRKAYRDQMTRAEFILSEVREAPGAPIPVNFFEPHKKQPQETVKEAKAKSNETGEEQSQGQVGLGKADIGKVTVKHEKATVSEIHLIDEVLLTGVKAGANFKCLVASIMTITQETHAQNLDSGEAGKGPFSQQPGTWGQEYPGGTMNVEEDAEGFFQVCIKNDKKDPNQSYGSLCDSVQNALNTGLYDQWESEAKATVERFLGGSTSVPAADETTFERYPFERKKKESVWKNTRELAKVVRWRRFMVGGVLFYYPESQLIQSKVRAVLDEEASGVESIDGEFHENIPTTVLTVTARAKTWSVPPGCVAELSKDMGALKGRYVVETIEASLLESDDLMTIKISKPTEPLPEPAPTSKTKGTGTTTSSNLTPAEAPQAIQRIIAEVEATTGTFTYGWGGGHESVQALHERLKKYDCSGYISHILWAAGLISSPVDSGTLANMYEPGEGEWLTIWANAEHVFAEVKTSEGWKVFESGGSSDNATGWVENSGEDKSRFTPVHPKGL